VADPGRGKSGHAPPSKLAMEFGGPLRKKGHQKFWKIDVEFWGMQKFFGKCLKKVVQKFREKFGPLVSEGLDPLVTRRNRS